MSDVTLLSVMKYLKQNKYEQSWLSLQQQSQIRLFTYSKQIQFFKKIILKGDFQQAIQFLNTLSTHIGQRNFKKACYTIYKQKLYELINTPNQKQLKKLFQKQLINCCNQQDFQNLFTLLTSRKTQQIQGLADWTVIKGRLKVFEQLLPLIQSILNSNKPNSQPNQSSQAVLNLDQAIAEYLQNQQKNKSQQFKGTIIRQVNKNASINVSNKSLGTINKQSSMVNKSQSFVTKQLQSNLNQPQLYLDRKESQLKLSQSQYQKSQIQGLKLQKKSQLYSNSQIQYKQSGVHNFKKNQSHITNKNESQHNFKNQNYNNSKNPSKIYVKQNNYFNNPSKNQYSGSKLYQQQQINQISEEQQRSDTVRSNKKNQKSKIAASNYLQQHTNSHQSQEIQQSSRQNIQYLQQTNSVVYNNQIERDHENFTFSHQNFTYDGDKPRKILKLSTISDNKAIRTCEFSSSGSYFAVGTNSSILKIFDVNQLFSNNQYKQLQPIYQINGLHSKSIFCLDWGKNQASMVTCSNDLTIKLTQFDHNFQSHQVSVIGRHESCIRMVKFNQDQNKIFSCGDDSLIKVWDMGKVKRCYNLKGHSAGISAFKICDNQNQLFSVSKDSTIKKWDLRTLQCVSTSKCQQSQMTYIANKTQRIVASNKNGNILFFDQQLNLQYQVKVHEQQIRSVQASRNQGVFLTASFDGHVGIFSQKMIHSPDYFQHNQNSQDKVVFATFLQHPQFKGFASTSTLGLCHIYSFN